MVSRFLKEHSATCILIAVIAAEIGACPFGSAEESTTVRAQAATKPHAKAILGDRTPAPVPLAKTLAPTMGGTAAHQTSNQVTDASSDLKNYLVVMRPMTHLYLHVMLSIIARDGLPSEDALDTQVTAAGIEGLEQQLSNVKPPAELERQHAALNKSLNAVAQFINAGGAEKVGFHSALELAQQMQAVSNSYHESVLALIQEHGLSASTDPFIVQKVAGKAPGKQQNVQAAKTQAQAISVPQVSSSDRIHGLSGSAAGVDFDGGGKVPSSASSASTTPTMIDGVGGSMGLSGMFNGLGGTGTNGLVDGMGFSSGLNGFVNGAGSSSGMSGMFNDINTSSASGTNKY